MEISKYYGQVISYLDSADNSDNSNISVIAGTEIDDYSCLQFYEYVDRMIAQCYKQTSCECIQVLEYLNRDDAFDYKKALLNNKSAKQSKIGE